MVLGLIVALLAVGRGGLFLHEHLLASGQDSVAQITEPGSIETVRGYVEAEEGETVVISVALAREESGALSADAVVLDPGDCAVQVSYRWFADNSFHSLEDKGFLSAEQVKPGVTYHVEAQARCGQQSGSPLRSGPMTVSPRSKGGGEVSP